MSMILLMGPLVLQAQEREVDYIADSVITPHFFIAVIAGVILAMGFQFILTALSVAAGITAVGDIKEKYVKGKYHPDKKDNLHDTDNDLTRDDDDDDDGMDTGTMITTGFGAWSVITTILSLFGATALAINLALIASPVIAITLGLVIWAAFFILLFYLESKVVNSLVGGLINTATSGLRASGEAVKNMFSTSKEAQMKNVAEDTVDKIRKDFSAVIDPKAINESIDEFFTRVDKSVPDYEKVKKDIKNIIEESDKRYAEAEKDAAREEGKELGKNQSSGGNPGKWMAIQQVMTKAIDQASDGDGSAQDKGKVEQLKKLQSELKDAYGEGDTGEEKLEKVVARFTSVEEEEVKGYIEKIKQVLSKVTPDEMEKGDINLQNKIMEIVKNPKVEGSKLASKLGEIDRDTIVAVLTENTELEKDQIEKYADKAQEMLKKVTGKVKEKAGSLGSSGSSADSSRSYSSDLSNGLRVEKKGDADMKQKLEKEVFKMINSKGKPDINFATVTSFFQGKMDSEGDTLDNLKRKLKNFDKDSAKAIVTSNTNIDQGDIDKWVQSIEDARQNVLDKIQKIEDETNRRLENLKRKAIIQAENTRKNAAAAAWWLVASALLSAGAAIGGSLLALG